MAAAPLRPPLRIEMVANPEIAEERRAHARALKEAMAKAAKSKEAEGEEGDGGGDDKAKGEGGEEGEAQVDTEAQEEEEEKEGGEEGPAPWIQVLATSRRLDSGDTHVHLTLLQASDLPQVLHYL